MSFIWKTRHPMVYRQHYLDRQKAEHEEFYRQHPDMLAQQRLITGLLLVVAMLILAFCSTR